MINLNHILPFLTAVLLLSSCNVLEQEPVDSLTPELAFNSEKSARAALNGMYSRMQNEFYYGAYFQYMADNYADVGTFQGFYLEFRDPDQGAIPTNNFGVEQIWLAIYDVINVANEIIEKTPAVADENFTSEERAEIVAQARCIRALAYFDLLTYYGEHWDLNSAYGLPLVTTSTNSDIANVESVPRRSVTEVYDLIIADLQAAEKDLPDSGDNAYATRALAKGLLARVYLYRKEYAAAEAEATEVIENPHFALLPDYAEIFFTNRTAESVFELVSTPQDPSLLAIYTITRDEVRPEPELIASFLPNDRRRNLIGVFPGRTGERFLKAEDAAADANPAYVLRMAELYLIRAEARFFLGREEEALADLNAVHTRAGPEPYADAGNFIDKLLDEYRWEFFQEGHRFRALVRLDRLQEVLGLEPFRRIYPIPFRELTIGGTLLEQNPGYGD